MDSNYDMAVQAQAETHQALDALRAADATIAELRAELAQLHSDFSTNAIALGKVAVERNELRADRDALPREVLEKVRKAIKNATGFVSCASGADDWCGCGDCRVEWKEHRKRMEAALTRIDELEAAVGKFADEKARKGE